MKSTNTKGFTLVELIIVITILAILATIAFISFQGYTKDARNSKRDSDINSISRSIEVKMANAIPATSFVDSNDTALYTVKSGGHIAGYSVANSALPPEKYSAGKLNFSILGAKAEDFQDPKGDNYKIGTTTLAGGAYEIATDNYETDSGTGRKIVGNYKHRTASSGGIISKTPPYGDYSFTIDSGLGILKVGDNTNIGVISGISNDLSVITILNFTGEPTIGDTIGFSDTGDEIESLICIEGDNCQGF